MEKIYQILDHLILISAIGLVANLPSIIALFQYIYVYDYTFLITWLIIHIGFHTVGPIILPIIRSHVNNISYRSLRYVLISISIILTLSSLTGFVYIILYEKLTLLFLGIFLVSGIEAFVFSFYFVELEKIKISEIDEENFRLI